MVTGVEKPLKERENLWHTLPADRALAELGTADEGLTAAEAAKRLAEFGPNVLAKKKGETALQLLWRQINSPLIWVLIASAGVAMIVDPVDGIKNGLVILSVVILNALIGYVQEARAKKAIEALKDFVPEFANVIREGKVRSLPVAELVPGDLVQVASGDRVPADMRLVKLKTLLIEEAALTGESVPSEKNLAAVEAESPLGDRLNMAFSGTLVTQGTGIGVVTTTGGNTELGRINTLLSEATEIETPLSKSLHQISQVLTVGIVVVAVLMVIVGTIRTMSQGGSLETGIKESLVFAITLAVGAIPEGLPAIVTIALAIGVQRMAQRRAVVRTLPSVETLGSTSTICSDKTGTLTKNEMTVQALWTPTHGEVAVTGVGYEPKGEFQKDGKAVVFSETHMDRLVQFGALCSDATLEEQAGQWKITGDPTEGALVAAAEKAGYDVDELRKAHPRLDAIPFESEHQFMATMHEFGGEKIVVIKGAPEAVLRRTVGADAEAMHRVVDQLAGQGMRVLGVASRVWGSTEGELTMESVATGFTLEGLQGMIDPPRQEVIEAIRVVHGAGVTVKMITGDHKKTAEAIAEQLNIRDGKAAVTGEELQRTSDDDLKSVVKNSNVFARVAPEHKLRLVRALQENGEVAAMTGDGVNDAPALKQSNIGIAMGITGTSVSKEAADIVLTDDNFASIVAAVEEGRRVYDNLIKSLAFVLPTNMGLALILIFAVAFFPFEGKELLLPMLPPQLLWINLVATVALALPLAFEAKEPDVMRRKPRNPNEPVLNRFVVMRTFVAAFLMAIGSVGLFLYEYYSELPKVDQGLLTKAQVLAEAQTMAVTTVIMFQIFYMLNCRSLRDSIFRIGLFSNKTVFIGIAGLLLLQLAFIYAPPLQAVFQTAALDGKAILYSVLAGAIILPVISFEKWLHSRKAA